MLRDICRADGPPTSQPELVRLPGQEREVNIFLREATRRLREAMKPALTLTLILTLTVTVTVTLTLTLALTLTLTLSLTLTRA